MDGKTASSKVKNTNAIKLGYPSLFNHKALF